MWSFSSRTRSTPTAIQYHLTPLRIIQHHPIILTTKHHHALSRINTHQHPSSLTTHYQLHRIATQVSTLSMQLDTQMAINSYKCWAGCFALALSSYDLIRVSNNIQTYATYSQLVYVLKKVYIKSAQSRTCEEVADSNPGKSRASNRYSSLHSLVCPVSTLLHMLLPPTVV